MTRSTKIRDEPARGGPPLHDPDEPIDFTAAIKRRSTIAGLIHEYRVGRLTIT